MCFERLTSLRSFTSRLLNVDDARRSVKTQSTELSSLRDELAQAEKTNTAALAEVRDAHARDTDVRVVRTSELR